MELNNIEDQLREYADSDGMLSPAALRRAMTESGLPKAIEDAKRSLNRPEPPTMPAGVPSTFMEAIFWPGPCVIPLWSAGRWSFALVMDGAPIRDNRTMEFVKFPTYDEAMSQLLGFLAALPPPPKEGKG